MTRTRIITLVAASGAAVLVSLGQVSTAQAATNPTYIRYGSTGTSVKCIQLEINYLYGLRIDVDGIFGSTTQTFVKRIQSDNNQPQDGIVGPKTGDAITRGLKVADPFETIDAYDCVHILPKSS